MKIRAGRKSFFIPDILALLVLGLVVRLGLAFFGTLRLDHNTFVAWSNILVGGGLANFYRTWSDYLPGYLYILWLLGKIRVLVPLFPTEVLYKLPAILADVVVGYFIYRKVKAFKNQRWGLILSAAYLFNPAVLANSTFWGQVDSLTILLVLLAVNLAEANPVSSGVIFALGVIIKPQALLAAPAIFFLALKNKWKIKSYFLASVSSLLAFGLLFLPFTNGQKLFNFIYLRILTTLSQYPYTSVNAFSFWALGGMWKQDNLPSLLVGYLVIVLTIVLVFVKVRKRAGGQFLLLTVTLLVGFLFQTRMHERHLLPVLAPLLISSAILSDLLLPYFVLSLTYIANLYYSYQWITYDFRSVFSFGMIKVFVIANLLTLMFVLQRILTNRWGIILPVLKRFMGRWGGDQNQTEEGRFAKIRFSQQKLKYLLWGVMLFTTLSRLAWLGSPPKMYFDEVYHAFTAKLVLHGDPKAWEWWNPHPEGFAYEWTHPPLAKLGMALGMKLLGENAWGWRIPGAILGVGCVYLVYLLAKALFKDELLAITSSAVLALDGLGLVMSRIGMNDTYLLFFMLLSLYFFLTKKDFLAAISFGLALASKWSAIWAVPILGLIWLNRKQKFNLNLLSFLLVPVVYLASYFQLFLTGHGFDIFWGMQKQMWWYHTGLKATHAYTSPWWSWPLDLRPVYLYTSDEVNGLVGRIYNLGNPAVFWLGLAVVLLLIIVIIAARLKLISTIVPFRKTLGLVLFAYLIFFVPWAASPRIMFFYHYLPSLPFLAIAVGYLLRLYPKLAAWFLVISLVVFLYFYPHWSGVQIPLWLDKSYYWFSSWR